MKTLFALVSAVVLFWVSALFVTIQAQTLGTCTGQYALCAASGATPTGKTMLINGKPFAQGVAVCPILTGMAIADLDMMGSCNAPKGKVWSLFGIPPVSAYPQAPTWEVMPAAFNSFKLTKENGMSNMWSYICDRQEKRVNGVELASCYGPINESPWTHNHVVQGETVFTQAPVGTINAVGGNLP